MMKKKKHDFKKLKAYLPYILTGIVTIGLVSFGSLDKQKTGASLSLDAFAKEDYKVSVDQLSGLYVVADISDILSLASSSDVARNYVIANSLYESGQSSISGKIEKPTIPNIVISHGVQDYVVSAGETMESIARKFGLTTDQIRWSNGKKNTDIAAGDHLYIPSVPGIVYTVKSGDTIESIASKLGSSADEIRILNDLELSGVSEGMRIVVRNGVLPEKERPEYVPPVPRYSTYTYAGSSSIRMNIEIIGYFYNLGGPYGRGQCTQWAWYNRQDLPSNLGNANTWAARAAAQGFPVNRTPAAGAVFQNGAGWYGHVGYVEAVNPDGSIVATEMNYNYTPFRAIRSTIPANIAATLNYIHRK